MFFFPADPVSPDIASCYTVQLLRISLICAFRIFSRFRTAFDGRRSTQAWLQNLAPFQVFINTSVIQDKTLTQPRPRPLLGWLWQVSLAGVVNFRLAFGNYRNDHLPRKGLVDFTSSQISPITL